MSDERLARHYDICGAALRESDRDRWLAAMFAPEAARPHLFALYAFNAEVARVRELVSQPMLGELRLKWWVDAIEGETLGDVRANPTADALLATIAAHDLPKQAFFDLIEARCFDLYDDPAPDTGFLLDYCDKTSSALFALAAKILGAAPHEDATKRAGRAFAVTGLLRALPWHVSRGQCFAPLDILTRHGLTAQDFLGGPDGPAVRSALGELFALALVNLAEAKKSIAALPRPEREAFRLLALPPLDLKALEREKADLRRTPVEIAAWRRQWALWRAKS
jgi:15-cis-phytoene synthase